jgi:hypothetical protein
MLDLRACSCLCFSDIFVFCVVIRYLALAITFLSCCKRLKKSYLFLFLSSLVNLQELPVFKSKRGRDANVNPTPNRLFLNKASHLFKFR